MDIAELKRGATEFAKRHLATLSAEVIHWQSTGMLPNNGRFHELAELVEKYMGSTDNYQQAERLVTRLSLEAVSQPRQIEAWWVEFENGAVELHLASEIIGEPGFGRWVTPLIAGGPAVDNDPDDDTE